MVAVTVSEQTAIVDEPKAWHKVIDEGVGYANEQVRVQYFRVKVERVDSAYTAAKWWSFNGHIDGSLYSVPDGMPAEVLAEAATHFNEEVAEYRND